MNPFNPLHHVYHLREQFFVALTAMHRVAPCEHAMDPLALQRLFHAIQQNLQTAPPRDGATGWPGDVQ